MNNMFFIVGTGRCGTQMMRNVLNCWPDVVILPETHFIIPLYDMYGLKVITVEEFLNVIDEIKGSSDEKWVKVILNSSKRSYDDYQEQFKNFVIANNIRGNTKVLIEAFYEFLYGKGKLFGDKTPHYGTNLSILKRIWPEAKIIHLVRDGIDCAHSMLGHPGFRRYINEDIRPKDLDRVMYKRGKLIHESAVPQMSDALEFWSNVVSVINDEISQLLESDVLLVKYENIVFKPAEEIYNISHFINIDGDKGALNRAICIPRPFPEKHQIKKFNIQTYREYYRLIEEQMKNLGYPYEVGIHRGFVGTLNEVYRGRYNYIHFFKINLKILIKKLLGK